MVPWIQVKSNLITHPKTAKLAEELKLSSSCTSPTIVAAGLLIGVWSWAIQNAYDGDLSKCSASVIADAARWKKKPEVLISALKKSGFLDPDMKLHDWEEYAVLLMNKEDIRKEKTRERVKRYRERKCNAECNATDTQSNAPTTPDPTLPYLTDTDNSGDGDIEIAHAHENSELSVENPMDIDWVVLHYNNCGYNFTTTVKDVTAKLFVCYGLGMPSHYDEAQVFSAIEREKTEITGKLTRYIDRDAVGLLYRAFSIAMERGKEHDWGYINGILRKFKERGINTVGDADEYDAIRDNEREGW